MDGKRILHTKVMHQRQHGIIHPKMAEMEVTIAGVGMIGGWTAHALSRAVYGLIFFDPDEVEDVNVGCQPYTTSDVGRSKVEALYQSLPNPYLRLSGQSTPFPYPGSHPTTALVSAVDSMSGRKANAEWARDHNVPLYLDGRIQGELAVLATVTTKEGYAEYLAALPTDDEVDDVPCGQSGTAYVGMFLASQIASTINQWCKGIPIPALRVWHVPTVQALPQVESKEVQ
ncbi:hypothetical protein LCGC14_0410080 [marine sediment metagenome]|uniref:THIF-type NAD/FAD binding fold domain-containing protein n=1 Tax=marine sediment metagenome TaxID=412755 RepID=A0A0F9SZT5_9ZZZZ